MTRFMVWFVSCFAHVFVPLWVVIANGFSNN